MVKIEIHNFGTDLENERLDELFSLDNENLIKEMNSWGFAAILQYGICYDIQTKAEIIINSDNDDLAEQKLQKFYETEKVSWGFTEAECTVNFSIE